MQDILAEFAQDTVSNDALTNTPGAKPVAPVVEKVEEPIAPKELEAKVEPEKPAEIVEPEEEPTPEEVVNEEGDEGGEPEEPAAVDFDWGSVGDGTFENVEALNEYIKNSTDRETKLKAQVESLSLKLEETQGINLTETEIQLNNLVKQVGEDKALLILPKVKSFKHDAADPIATLVAKQVLDNPDLMGMEAGLTERILAEYGTDAESYEDLSAIDQALLKSDSKKAASEIAEMQEGLNANTPKAQAEEFETKRAEANLKAKEIISEGLKVSIPGVENMTIDVGDKLAKHEAYMTSLMSKYGTGEDQVNQIKQAVSDELLKEAIKDGSFVKSLRETLKAEVKMSDLKEKSNPSTTQKVAKPNNEDSLEEILAKQAKEYKVY